MQSGGQQQVTLGNQQALDYQTQNGVLSTTRKLWGSKPRVIGGTVQSITGLIEIVLGIVVVALPSLNTGRYTYYYDRLDIGAWGIWCGAFGILTGCFGLGSQRKKSMVLTYTVLSIIAAVLCGICIIAEVESIVAVKRAQGYYERRLDYNYGSYHNARQFHFNSSRAKAHLILYIFLLVSFFTNGLISIIGASFGCGALCKKCGSSNQGAAIAAPYSNQRVVYYQPTQVPVIINGPAPPYAAVPPTQPDPNVAYDPQYPTKNGF